MTSALGERLRAVVGAEHLADGASAAVDGVAPRFVARPANVAEVSRLLGLAHAAGLAVAPRGAGTAQGLGNPPTRLALVIALGRLNRVVEYEPADVTVSVEAGMTLDDLERVLGKHRQILPLDPPGWRPRTVGGVLATNASGPWRFRYGTGRHALLGLRFVQADGTVTWGGSRGVRSATGSPPLPRAGLSSSPSCSPCLSGTGSACGSGGAPASGRSRRSSRASARRTPGSPRSSALSATAWRASAGVWPSSSARRH